MGGERRHEAAGPWSDQKPVDSMLLLVQRFMESHSLSLRSTWRLAALCSCSGKHNDRPLVGSHYIVRIMYHTPLTQQMALARLPGRLRPETKLLRSCAVVTLEEYYYYIPTAIRIDCFQQPVVLQKKNRGVKMNNKKIQNILIRVPLHAVSPAENPSSAVILCTHPSFRPSGSAFNRKRARGSLAVPTALSS